MNFMWSECLTDLTWINSVKTNKFKPPLQNFNFLKGQSSIFVLDIQAYTFICHIIEFLLQHGATWQQNAASTTHWCSKTFSRSPNVQLSTSLRWSRKTTLATTCHKRPWFWSLPCPVSFFQNSPALISRQEFHSSSYCIVFLSFFWYQMFQTRKTSPSTPVRARVYQTTPPNALTESRLLWWQSAQQLATKRRICWWLPSQILGNAKNVGLKVNKCGVPI